MAPCCTAQSDGGGIYPASEGTGRGKCEVQRAFPRHGPGPEAEGRSPRAGSPSARAATKRAGSERLANRRPQPLEGRPWPGGG